MLPLLCLLLSHLILSYKTKSHQIDYSDKKGDDFHQDIHHWFSFPLMTISYLSMSKSIFPDHDFCKH